MNNPSNKYKKIIILLLFLFIISTFFAWLFYLRSKQTGLKLFQKPVPTKTVRINPNQSILSELEKRLVLPKGSSTIFNLSDLAGLTKQPFFAGAKPTDKLILFQEEKKAVLYDPIAQQIINIGPLLIVPATQEAEITKAK